MIRMRPRMTANRRQGRRGLRLNQCSAWMAEFSAQGVPFRMEVKRDSFLRAHLRHLNQLMRGPYTIQLSEKFNRKTEPQNFLARSLRTHSRRSCENEVVFPRLHEPSANSKLHLL